MKNILTIDADKSFNLNPIWRFGVNTCHAKLWLDKMFVEHMNLLQKELRFKHVRCHGIFNDELEIVSPDITFDFSRPIQILGTMLKSGYKPFIELASMPGPIASNDKSICHYKFRSAPPKDWKLWENFLTAFMKELVEHFGIDELLHWYFEVWNEPDLAFWSGTREEYFRLYEISRKVIKNINSKLRVGGPATSRTAWIQEFSEFCGPEGCDFVSTHAYPSDLAFLDSAVGEVKLQNANIMRTLFKSARTIVNDKLGTGIPFFIGEWNSSAGPFTSNHDECGNAAFICKTMAELRDICAGSMYWNATDIYEECGFHFEPFHGGYGLLTINGIKKSSFHAFRLLSNLYETGVNAYFSETNDEHGALASCSGNNYNILVWNYLVPGTRGTALKFQINGIPSDYSGKIEFIEPGHGSPYETWESMGKPMFIDHDRLVALKSAARPRIQEYSFGDKVFLAPGMVALIKLSLN